MSDPCPDCGRDRVLVGYRHNCVVPTQRKIFAGPDRVDSTIVAGLERRIIDLQSIVASLKLELEASKHCHAKDNEYHQAEIAKLSTGQSKLWPPHEAPSRSVRVPSIDPYVADLQRRILELEELREENFAENAELTAEIAKIKAGCPACKKRQNTKTKAQKKRREKKEPT